MPLSLQLPATSGAGGAGADDAGAGADNTANTITIAAATTVINLSTFAATAGLDAKWAAKCLAGGSAAGVLHSEIIVAMVAAIAATWGAAYAVFVRLEPIPEIMYKHKIKK